MPNKDIFDKPFDEGTIIKLEIFEKYLEKWLPTFIMSSYSKPIQIFDFFSGSGYDKDGNAGSPLRTLEVIKKHTESLKLKKKNVFLYLNDLDKTKVENLKSEITHKVKDYNLSNFVTVSFSNNNFAECLNIYNKELHYGCNLIFIDQNGIKEVTEPVFRFLLDLETSEFMFFISSSYIHRFAMEPEIQKYHPKFNFNKIRNASRKVVHNVICDEFVKYVPNNIKSYSLIPFSIMKEDHNNIYGLIFVCKHILGADKFLQTVWKMNIINGKANFDIDEDLQKDQFDFFEGKKLTKIEDFQRKLKELIIAGEIKTNIDAYFFTLNSGHINQHANEVILRMKKDKIITFDNSSPLVNYNNAIKNKYILEYVIPDYK